jgi:nucleoside-diphosphate-sugar epimerase
MVNCVVTGAQGSGGSYLTEYILNLKAQIEVWAPVRWRSNSGELSNSFTGNLKVVECDLNDLSSTIRFLVQAQPDIVFHLAAHANVRASFDVPLAVYENNTRSTHNLLEALRILNLKPRFILASTSEVYGNVEPSALPIKETQRLNPVSPYAASKASQEMLALSYFHSFGIPVVITRMFTYLNPRRNDLFATAFVKQILDFKHGKIASIRHGNLSSVRSILDVRDSSRAYWKAASYCNEGDVYNIGGSTNISVGEFLHKLLKLTDVSVDLREDPNLLRPADVVLQIPDSQKFRSLTGWSEEYDLESSIAFLLSEVEKIGKQRGIPT